MQTITRTRVARAVRPGGPDVIELSVVDLSPPGPGEALVRVEAVGLNHADTLIRSGDYAVTMPFPLDVGVEAAGTVVATGPEVVLPPGTRVAGTGWLGACADFVTVPAERLVPVPSELDTEAAACVAHAAAAAGALTRVWPVAGRTAAVWGAAGAVGRLLVPLLTALGAEVVGIASGDRVAVPRALGAAHVVDRSAGRVAEDVRAATGGRGVDVVFDPVASATFRTSLAMLAPRGCLVNYGQLDGPISGADFAELYRAGGVFVTKFNAGAYVSGYDDVRGLIAAGLDLAATRPGVVSPVAGRFGLDEVAAAYRALEAGAPGKVLVLPTRGGR